MESRAANVRSDTHGGGGEGITPLAFRAGLGWAGSRVNKAVLVEVVPKMNRERLGRQGRCWSRDGAHRNRRWGFLSRAGVNDKSQLSRQIEKYADIYTSRVSNFQRYTPYSYFRSPSQSVAHDRNISQDIKFRQSHHETDSSSGPKTSTQGPNSTMSNSILPSLRSITHAVSEILSPPPRQPPGSSSCSSRSNSQQQQQQGDSQNGSGGGSSSSGTTSGGAGEGVSDADEDAELATLVPVTLSKRARGNASGAAAAPGVGSGSGTQQPESQ
ncbi:MAG: hypothetical protein WDW38_005147 [Sanguina aurantia]